MAPKKALEPVTIDKEKLTALLEQLNSDDTAQVLEGLQTLLRGTEESADLKVAASCPPLSMCCRLRKWMCI